MLPFRIVNAGTGLSYGDCTQLDLFCELAVPDFAMRNEAQEFQDTLEELALAETRGFRTTWLAEHHFFFMRGFSHSSAPEGRATGVRRKLENGPEDHSPAERACQGWRALGFRAEPKA